MARHDSFHKGDQIEVTAAFGTDDFGTIRGTAMDTRGQTGDAGFGMLIVTDGSAQNLYFNLNRVDVKLLFDAGVARRMAERG